MPDDLLQSLNATSGSCKCGVAGYRIATDIRRVVNCHCNFCRQMNGSAFSTYAVVPRKYLTVTGEGNIAEYRAAPGFVKRFCAKCGTPLYNLNDRYPNYCMIYLGTLANCGALRPAANIYCESMLGWAEQIASLERFGKSVDGT